MRRFFVGLIFSISHLTLYSQTSYDSDIFKALPFSNTAVTLDSSWIKHRENLNTKYLRSLDPDRLLHNFKVNAGLPSNAKPLDGWEAPSIGLRGHFVGHYLSALANVVQKQNDPSLNSRINYIVDELY